MEYWIRGLGWSALSLFTGLNQKALSVLYFPFRVLSPSLGERQKVGGRAIRVVWRDG
jgi:hypothetical protein